MARPEDTAHAVLDNPGEELAADASHAHVPAGGCEVVCPLLLGIAVTANWSGDVNQPVSKRTVGQEIRRAWVLGYARVGEADGVRDVEDERERDDWHEAD